MPLQSTQALKPLRNHERGLPKTERPSSAFRRRRLPQGAFLRARSHSLNVAGGGTTSPIFGAVDGHSAGGRASVPLDSRAFSGTHPLVNSYAHDFSQVRSLFVGDSSNREAWRATIGRVLASRVTLPGPSPLSWSSSSGGGMRPRRPWKRPRLSRVSERWPSSRAGRPAFLVGLSTPC